MSCWATEAEGGGREAGGRGWCHFGNWRGIDKGVVVACAGETRSRTRI